MYVFCRLHVVAVAVFDTMHQQECAGSSGRGSQPQQQEDRGSDRKRHWDEGKSEDPQAAAAGSSGGSSIRGLPSPMRPPSRGGKLGAPSAAVCELVRRALTVGFANRIARRMRLHNGYRTCNEKGVLAQIHPGSSQLAADDDGLLPEWLIYNEFVATSRPFLRQVKTQGRHTHGGEGGL